MGELFIGIIVLVPIIVGGTMLYRFMTKYENGIEQQLRASAQASGATYWKGQARDSPLQSILLTGAPVTYIRHAIFYTDGTQVGQAHFTLRQSTILFDFATVPISKYPSLWLVIDSRKNNILDGSLMDTAGVGRQLEPIVLEGNFPSTYKVYMNKGQQIAALVALNPASMEKLVYIFDKYDMEICNNRLFIYTIGTQAFYNPETREQMIQDVKMLAAILQ